MAKKIDGRSAPHYQLHLGGDARTGEIGIGGPMIPAKLANQALALLRQAYGEQRQGAESVRAWAERLGKPGIAAVLAPLDVGQADNVFVDWGDVDEFAGAPTTRGECAAPFAMDDLFVDLADDALITLDRALAVGQAERARAAGVAAVVATGRRLLHAQAIPAEEDVEPGGGGRLGAWRLCRQRRCAGCLCRRRRRQGRGHRGLPRDGGLSHRHRDPGGGGTGGAGRRRRGRHQRHIGDGGMSLDAMSRLDGRELIAMAASHFAGRIAVTSSFGAESAVLLDLVAQVDASLPVIFLDTGELFDETLDYRYRLERVLGLTNVVVVRPTEAERKAAEDLWRTDADRCCELRKVRPLVRAVGGYAALIDGRKRAHGFDRDGLGSVQQEGGVVKISPLANWSEEQIEAHFQVRNLPRHPLVAQGYRSIGCWPCTRPTKPGEPARAGRWAGSAKTECGIHTVPLGTAKGL
ncbi:MAG: phosphoadenylyl-sulfate reductase [Magnetospirillum sp.]|nr:phosphoadenylyl-sulfate reductase [Magnetospirillum sp.]